MTASDRSLDNIEAIPTRRRLRLRDQQKLFIELIREYGAHGDNLTNTMRHIAEMATKLLCIERVSLWRFNGQRAAMRCMVFYQRTTNRHGAGLELATALYPTYFEALAASEVIIADDAGNDPRTHELVDSYLRPFGITAMMTVPIMMHGKLEGTICYEQIGVRWSWGAQDQLFAIALSGLVTLVLEQAERQRAEIALRDSEERFRQLTENIRQVFWMSTPGLTDWIYISPSYESIWGRKRDELFATPTVWFNAIHEDDRETVRRAVSGRHSLGEYDEEYRIVRPDRSVRWIRDRAFPIRDSAGNIYRIAGIADDVTDRKQLEDAVFVLTAELERRVEDRTRQLEVANAALRASERRQRALLDAMPDAMFRISRDGTVLDYSSPWGSLPGAGGVEIGTNLTDEGVSQELRAVAMDAAERALLTGDIETAEYMVHGGNGPEHYEARFVRSGKDEVVAILRNITKQRSAEERVNYLAHFDQLTNLPNRVLLRDRMTQLLTTAHRYKHELAILFVDLDHFKHINDSLGHHAGDRLLQAVADDLRRCVRETDTIARLGGDEFIILLAGAGAESAVHVAGKVLETVSSPYFIDGHELSITPSIGISIYPYDGVDSDTLIRNADAALYHAKDLGRQNYQFFTKKMNEAARERVVLEAGLRQALEREEFTLHYQPQADLFSGEIIGTEALLRWDHPEQGLVSPTRFISVAEESGLIVQIGRWILREACLQNAEWQVQRLPRTVVAVNISAMQFRQKNFVNVVKQVLADTSLDPKYLELEITESVVMRDAEATIASLKSLNDLGVQLAIDDFGTGYSSLSYLKRLPIHKLKIDRSFVRDAPKSGEDAAIVQAIISMAHSLRMKVIAEGVETKEQLVFLRRMQCDEVQGYYVSKPLAAADCARRIRLSMG